MTETITTRIELARARVDAATRRARTARIVAAPALRHERIWPGGGSRSGGANTMA